MYNYVLLVGTLNANGTKSIRKSDGMELLDLELAVQRPFRNSEGEHETDIFNVEFWSSIVEEEQFRKGDHVGIKGRLVPTQDRGIKIVGERIIFYEKKECERNECNLD